MMNINIFGIRKTCFAIAGPLEVSKTVECFALCSSLKQLLLTKLKPKWKHISNFVMPFYQLNHIILAGTFCAQVCTCKHKIFLMSPASDVAVWKDLGLYHLSVIHAIAH